MFLKMFQFFGSTHYSVTELVKKLGDFFKILWPSQNVWTLLSSLLSVLRYVWGGKNMWAGCSFTFKFLNKWGGFLTPAPQVHFFKFCSLFRKHQNNLSDFVILGQPMRGAYYELSVLFLKGQIVSEGNCCGFNSSKKRTKNFCPDRWIFKFVFFGKIEYTTISFRH